MLMLKAEEEEFLYKYNQPSIYNFKHQDKTSLFHVLLPSWLV